MFESGIAEASTGLSAKDKIDAALRFVVAYQQSYSGSRMVDIEPDHVIETLAQVFPVMRERLERLLPGPGQCASRGDRRPCGGIALPGP